jgi:hypothetical protein
MDIEEKQQDGYPRYKQPFRRELIGVRPSRDKESR